MADGDAAKELSQMLQIPTAEAAALLAQANNDASVAAALFFTRQAQQEVAAGGGRAMEADDEDEDEDEQHIARPAPNPSFAVPLQSGSQPPAKEPRRTGMATLASLSEEKKKKDNEFYAGGQHSGIAVQGRPDPMSRDAFFEQAKQLGVTYDEYARQEREAAQQKPVFKGLGYKLGESAEQPAQVEGVPLAQQMAAEPQIRKIKVTFWKGGGFSVDDGEETPVLRLPNEEANQRFLKEVARGQQPKELNKYGSNIDLEVEDRCDEDFVPPKRRIKAFAGEGHRLGAPTPNVGASAAAASSAAASAEANAASDPLPPTDPSKPTTQIQLRLADGTRIVAVLNTDMTVADLRRFVAAARPTNGRNFVLVAGFPAQELKDSSQTLEQAGLIKGVVHQKWA